MPRIRVEGQDSRVHANWLVHIDAVMRRLAVGTSITHWLRTLERDRGRRPEPSQLEVLNDGGSGDLGAGWGGEQRAGKGRERSSGRERGGKPGTATEERGAEGRHGVRFGDDKRDGESCVE